MYAAASKGGDLTMITRVRCGVVLGLLVTLEAVTVAQEEAPKREMRL